MKMTQKHIISLTLRSKTYKTSKSLSLNNFAINKKLTPICLKVWFSVHSILLDKIIQHSIQNHLNARLLIKGLPIVPRVQWEAAVVWELST